MMARLQTWAGRSPEAVTKSFYFLFYAASASLVPFLVIYYEQLGFSGRQIGLLAAIPPLVMLLGAPIWGALADITQKQKRWLLTAIAGSLVMVFIFAQTTSFVWLIPIVAVYAFFAAPIMPLVDASTMNWLGARRHRYGRIRLWGAIGWGVAAPVAGWLIEVSGVQWAFWGYITLMFIGLLVAWLMTIQGTSIRQPFWRGIRRIAGDRQWLAFLVVTFIGGTCLAIIGNYLFLYMNELGASKTLMGLSLTVATISEVPVLYYSDKLLGRWQARGLLLIALLAYIIRALAYSLVNEPWLFLGIQLLHGLTFSAMWVAGVSYANSNAPTGLESTAQGLFSGILLGLGGIAGALIGGFLYDEIGAVALFRLTAVAVAMGVAVFYLISRSPTAAVPAVVAARTPMVGGIDDDPTK